MYLMLTCFPRWHDARWMNVCIYLANVRETKTQIVKNVKPLFCRMFFVRGIYASPPDRSSSAVYLESESCWYDMLHWLFTVGKRQYRMFKQLWVQSQANTDIIAPRDTAWRGRRKCFLYYSRRELPFYKYLSLPDPRLKMYHVSTQIWHSKENEMGSLPGILSVVWLGKIIFMCKMFYKYILALPLNVECTNEYIRMTYDAKQMLFCVLSNYL